MEEIFRHKVFKMLLSKEKITEDLVDMLMSWPPAPLPARRAYRPEGRAYASESGIQDLMSSAGQGCNLEMKRLCPDKWGWFVILSGLLFAKRARPGATRLPVVGLGYALFQTWLFKCTGLVIGLGQGMTYVPEEDKVAYQSKDGM